MDYVFTVPKELQYANLHDIKCKIDEVVQKGENEFALDFSNCEFIFPDAIVALSIIFRNINHINKEMRITISYNANNKSNEVIMYLAKIGFLKENYFEYNKPLMQFMGKCVEITRIDNEDNTNRALDKIRQLLETDNLSAISTAVSELIMNVFHHSETSICYVCAQTYSKDNSIVIAVADGGIGYFQQLSKTYDYIKDSTDALKLALTKKVTGNLDANRNNSGMGLYLTEQIMKENKGELSIHSGDALYQMENCDVEYTLLNDNWQGVLVSIKYYKENPVSMEKVNENWIYKQDDYDNMLSMFS